MFSITKDAFIDLRKKVLEKDFARMNPVQQEAVFATEGPLLILAGAGSGKTTVVVNRIANLIRYGKAYHSSFVQDSVTDADIAAMQAYLAGGTLPTDTQSRIAVSASQPWRVMAITFTNKAAGELKQRLVQMLGTQGNDIWASTFHASCARILRRDGARLGYTNHFTIYDTDDSRRMMKDCMKLLEIAEKNMPAKAILSEISRAKDSLVSPEEFETAAGNDFRLKQIAKAYRMYQGRLKDADAMDFDDLIVNTVRLLTQQEEVRAYYQERFAYMMVDEYQDTNHAQYQLVRLLAGKHQNLCVVGDDDQSIYKFRGATIENILSFERTFADAKVIRLEQNYRSTQNILDAANGVIANNTARKGKNLWTKNPEGEPIRIFTAENEQEEADKVATEILRLVAGGMRYSDFAVLYRMNAQSLTFERMFAKQGIPHRILGGTRFYDRAEIKDMLAYLSVVNNPNDEIRLRRMINRPKRGIGDRTVELAVEIGQQVGESLFTVICKSDEYPALGKAAKRLQEFGAMVQRLMQVLEDDDKSLNDLYMQILRETDYESFLKSDEPEKAADRFANVQELASNIARYEQEGLEGGTEPSLSAFLEEISLISDIDNYDGSTDTTVLMTVHSAKGLEFPVVFLPGWEESVFPGMASMYNPVELEEERRLAYVAITRAKERVYIYSAEQRMVFGSTTRNKMSRFAEEIPESITERGRSSRFGRAYGAAVGQEPSLGSNTLKLPSFGKGSVVSSGSVATAGGGFSAGGSGAGKGKTPSVGGKLGYKEGDKVQHKTFGAGMILSTRPMGNDVLLEIAFDTGTKLLGANFAKLTKDE